eukprot:CAMPEP_0202348266 /NCGR_PEP_ID=MMETSP1126-20121109/6272_1 /ASSEMBLY_ACC=CAM_ASM_000457 /TAXON_ID=3047 /ORGANISM="Dunaliella tertiolecta, Strain CCMP1320" /LENGTH=118 /DNA_ID=CAMNT_0048939933 /DNA_START=469 /DNA_END=826 /DNA_ORIENTATION=-
MVALTPFASAPLSSLNAGAPPHCMQPRALALLFIQSFTRSTRTLPQGLRPSHPHLQTLPSQLWQLRSPRPAAERADTAAAAATSLSSSSTPPSPTTTHVCLTMLCRDGVHASLPVGLA